MFDPNTNAFEPSDASHATGARAEVPPLTNAELVQLQVRMIALENLLVALLAQASEEQREMAREMAAFISPREGFTQHRLTLHAAAEIISLVDRAERFRTAQPLM